jgi:hypothetical protein
MDRRDIAVIVVVNSSPASLYRPPLPVVQVPSLFAHTPTRLVRWKDCRKLLLHKMLQLSIKGARASSGEFSGTLLLEA